MAGQYFFKIDDKFLPLSGGTVSGNTYFDANFSANTINIVSAPNNNNSLIEILARNSLNGNVEYVDVQHIISAATSQDKFVTGGTYDSNTDTINLSRNDSVQIDITGITDTFITGGTFNENLGLLSLYNNKSEIININNFFTGVTLSNIVFVNPNGDDLVAIKGRLDKPFKTLYAAKTASTYGDIIYVFSQTIEYDNRNSVGNPWNGRQDEINLWKDGITYYFELGTKILIKTENLSQQLDLFNPGSSTGETCTVDGYLEFENLGFGSDSGGIGTFLSASGDNGYTFKANVKRLYSDHNQIVSISKNNVVGTVANITINSEEEVWRYSGGNVSAGSFYYIQANGTDSLVNFNAYSKKRDYYFNRTGYAFYVRNTFDKNTKINITGQECYNLTTPLFRFRQTGNNPEVNVNIDRIYYDYSSLTFSNGIITETFATTTNTQNFTLNINADLIDYSENSYNNQTLFEILSPNIKINYKGNIYTKTNGGTGRSIVICGNYPFGNGYSSNNQINIIGNIYLLGSSETTSTLFQSWGANSIINFRGNIIGNFQRLANPKFGGIININNSKIESDANSFLMLDHTDTTTSTFTLKNSSVSGKNDLGTYADGQYLNVLINNSSIINSGSGDTISNNTNFGKLQLLNSSIYSNGGLSINYPTSSEVVTSNLIVNTDYSATTHNGDITILTDLIT